MQETKGFVALYEEHYPRVVAYARRRLGSLADAEDCASEVFQLAWEREDHPSAGWLFVTAKNITYARRRKETRMTDLCQRIANELGTSSQSSPNIDPDILDAMDRLSDNDRELLMAHYWDDFSGAQCAELIGCSVGAVWVRLHRARSALRKILLAERPAPEALPNTRANTLTYKEKHHETHIISEERQPVTSRRRAIAEGSS